MFIDSLTVSDFRCFAYTEIKFNSPARRDVDVAPLLPNVNLFLGDNGAGKSSIFKAVVVAVLSPVINRLGFPVEYLVRRDDNRSGELLWARLGLTLRYEHPLDNPQSDMNDASDDGFLYQSVAINRIGRMEKISVLVMPGSSELALSYDDQPSFFLVGYSANRRTEHPEGYSERLRSIRYQRVAGLFEDHVGLVPIAYGTLQLQKRNRFAEARSLLNSLLPDDAGVSLTEETDSLDNPLFDVRGAKLPFSALSDGFRTFIGWVWDLCLQIARVAPADIKLVELPGVVIVDEIDLFLHPKWQREVVGQVARAFPRIQFLFSTHSPIVAGSLEPANIFVLETDADGAAVVKQYEENIFGLSADQVLTSSYFDVDTPRASEMERELQSLADKAGDGDVDAAREYLQLLRKGL